MTSSERFPDIEIYVLNTTLENIIDWLNTELSEVSQPIPQGTVVKLTAVYHGQTIPITVTPGAAGKKFTSVIFDSDATPWDTDLDCARAAYKHFESEIRCSASSWVEEEAEDAPELWWKVNDQGEKKINWH
ncbi:hypothetical protein BTA51_25495 [Hahella sp. CCB-MM4]|uniref:hypothetical protein n=1 Tax=Hahella sp. (strain CCB-MM4) TaxID=1926491 RepID=UPI000B9BA785|nr:hypothetical protein [Hahella sp. CCB-MM4]OZG70491.1 hypothetical protein BTA51_25495 [Hahella sp. CCB-MM4]